MLSHEFLRELLHYDPKTGIFTWKKQVNQHSRLGAVAGSTTFNGYVHICVRQRYYYAHRLAWFYVYKTWPPDDLDHIDRVRTNNAIANLRLATRRNNCWYMQKKKKSKAGYKGVYQVKNSWRFYARIRVHGKPVNLGGFDTAKEAHAAYIAKARELHGEFFHAG